ncbi:20196_t:CDS:2 [Gigaspora margarita]|uniref:20196_t:CDS:1 n=1 Tax=Gigaspora margarita TaxID=4874 RepID=A0ABN7V2B9_GIGMA|nr:20196_t:CDS:2 [Gigaspora margarita]
MSGDISPNYEDGVLNIIHWLAPEKMYEYMSFYAKKRPYTQKCEIFSFGMMLWELCFDRVPYQGKNMEYITNHVTNGGRERIPIYSGSKEGKEIYWNLLKLLKWYVPPGYTPDILRISGLSDEEDLYMSDEDIKETNEIEGILEVDQGIDLHETKNPVKRKIAWKCFVANAAKGTQKQTMKDQNKALYLFKTAADDGITDAQLRYSIALKELKDLKANDVYEEFMHYLMLAAVNGNPIAMFNLSDIYLNGKLKEKKDVATDIRYLKLAALNKNEKAITLANQKSLNIYDTNYTEF